MKPSDNIKFTGFTQATIDFMWGLRLNNNKAWFEEHKEDFIRDFQTPMKALGQEVFERISDKYNDHGFIHKLSRVYKDARRIKDGQPYRPNLWFSIEKPSEEWTSTPVFWFELSPEDWSYGVGFYAAKAQTMTNFRARVDGNPKAFEKLIAPIAMQDEFVLEGDEYARRKVSAGELREAAAEWYNKKGFSLIHRATHGNELFSAEFPDRLVSGYEFLMPYYDYFVSLMITSPPRFH
ncbi:MAG: DUF2461 domain-containing protein [Oscillospiraceae bacterium]|nr:DUF2461 domain-containing protein [Oscillospiraceae bacterium]